MSGSDALDFHQPKAACHPIGGGGGVIEQPASGEHGLVYLVIDTVTLVRPSAATSVSDRDSRKAPMKRR
jgi:hypothetical protein